MPRPLWVIGTGVVAVIALLTVVSVLPPSPRGLDTPLTEFSAGRAHRHVQAIAARPHPTGSAAHADVRAYLIEELLDLGLRAETQQVDDLVNVMAAIPGSASTDAVLLTAHYDSTLTSPGASDDASGVAAILEAGRAMLARGPMRNTVVLLFTDGEEAGVLGARAFIEHSPVAADIKVVIGLDAGGVTGPSVLSAVSPDNGWLVGLWLDADASAVGSSAINALATSSTDTGRAFIPAGFPGYAFDLYWDITDGPDDTVADLSLAGVQHQGEHVLALASRLAALDDLAVPAEPDLVFFDLLGQVTVRYPSTWAQPGAAVLLLVLAGLLAQALRRGMVGWRGLTWGGVTTLGAAAIVPLPILLLGLLAGPFVPGLTEDWGYSALDQPPLIAAIVVAGLAIMAGWYRLAIGRTRVGALELCLGALLAASVGLSVTSVAIPGVSYGFAWSMVGAVVGVAAWIRSASTGRGWGATSTVLLASSGLAIAVSGQAIVLGLFDQLPLALGSLGALCGLVIPQLWLAGQVTRTGDSPAAARRRGA